MNASASWKRSSGSLRSARIDDGVERRRDGRVELRSAGTRRLGDLLERDRHRRLGVERRRRRSAARRARSRSSRGRSARRPGWPCACSGERYCAVPMIEPVSVMSDAPARAMPKSVTLARPSSSTITLCGLMSRCTTPRRCAKRAALRIWIDEVDRERRVERAVVAHDLLEVAARAGTPSRCSRCRPTRRGRTPGRRSGAARPAALDASRRKRSTNSSSSAKRR